MKNLYILSIVLICSISAAAQVAKCEPILITRDSALMMRTGQEALGVPLTDSILSGTVSFIDHKSNYSKTWSPAKGMSDNVIQQLMKQCHTHDRMVFSDFVVIEDGQQKKIEKKTYVFK